MSSGDGKKDKNSGASVEQPAVLFGGDLNKMMAAGEEMEARVRAKPKPPEEKPLQLFGGDVNKMIAAGEEMEARKRAEAENKDKKWVEKSKRAPGGDFGPGGPG